MKLKFLLFLKVTLFLVLSGTSLCVGQQRWGAYGPWIRDKCFDGIEVRWRKKPDGKDEWRYGWEIRSSYSKVVNVVLRAYPASADRRLVTSLSVGMNDQVTLKPSQSKNSEESAIWLGLLADAGGVLFYIHGVSFDFSTHSGNENLVVANKYESECEPVSASVASTGSTTSNAGDVGYGGSANAVAPQQTTTAGNIATAVTAISGIITTVNNRYAEEIEERKRRKIEGEKALAIEYATRERVKQAFDKDNTPVASGKRIEEGITVQSVIDRHINAIGGLEKLKTVQNMTINTTKEWDGSTHTYKTLRAYGKYGDFFIYGDGGTKKMTQIVFNGVKGYYDEIRKIRFDKEEVVSYQKTQPFEILMLQQNPGLILSGEKIMFRGRECYALIEKCNFELVGDQKLKAKESEVYNRIKKHYFDAVSGLWAGTEIGEEVKYNARYDWKEYIYYDDYWEANGILFPFTKITIANFNPDKPTIYKTTEIKFNEPLTDKDFEW